MKFSIFILLFLTFPFVMVAQTADKSDWKGGYPEACTSITVGKKASFDGSVMTSHTDDSHRTRSWIDIVPPKKYKAGDVSIMYKREQDNSRKMPAYGHKEIGSFPQVKETNGFINTAYPSMNDKQLAMGESTFGGRDELQSDAGLIDCQRLCLILLERCETAREAITLSGELLDQYGWRDYGECLTISDPKEVWHLEIVGPGAGKIGAIWAAQRVPDDHISVNANASTIKEMNLDNPDYFMASKNIKELAEEKGYWNPANEPFRFNYAFAPHSRTSFASRRREWRVFELAAPSLGLDPNASDYPFSIKPDTLITLDKMVSIFKDYYEGTEFDMTKNLLVPDADGKSVISPLANPHMPYDALTLHHINGGWGALGERTIARWYTMYGTIIQSRDWLPDMIGGVEWLAMDNIATSIYIPVYAGTTDLPKAYKTPGRDGFTYESSWWAFNRMSTLTAQRWGDMRHDVDAVFVPMQKELFKNASAFEKEVLELYQKNPKKAQEKLTEYTLYWGNKVVDQAWQLGNDLWTKYDEKF
ncbi:MAG: C69 family dipeptidase [Bacteroidales bacterium]|nr:C69 family dipeptidase [Bacteroidales bacterium]